MSAAHLDDAGSSASRLRQLASPLSLNGNLKRSNGADRLDALQNAPNGSHMRIEQAEASRNEPKLSASSQEIEPHAPSSDNDGLDRELEALALSSSITELDYAVQLTFSLLFEVQELRHTPTEPTQITLQDPALNDVDLALAKLDEHLDATAHEVSTLQARVDSISNNDNAPFVSDKWKELLEAWQKAQQEAEDMRRELLEDKYLIVYRTVSKQADDMIASLEKIIAQCSTFVQEVHTTYSSTGKQPLSPVQSELLQTHLNTFIALHKSHNQKTKYYIPSCEHVLKTIDSGIAQQQSLNGEVLRGHSDMKLRWRNLQERLTRIDREMQSAQDLLSALSARAQERQGHSKTMSITSSSASSDATRSSSKDSLSTPSKTPLGRGKSADHLTPSPRNGKQESPSSSRAVSPFRKIANRLKSSRSGKDDSPPPPVPMIPSSSTEASRPHSPSSTTSSSVIVMSKPGPYSARPSIGAVHRHTQSSLLSSPATSSRPSYMSSTLSERAPSPLPGSSRPATDNRPRWNASTKPVREDLSSSLSSYEPRKSMPYDTPTRSMTPANHVQSGRLTPSLPTGYARPASRNFTAPVPPFAARPASPAFSTTSNSSQAHRLRPTSPNSRIPAPGASPSKGRQSMGGANMRKPRASAPALGDDNLETLFFRSGSPDAGQASSLMQRALSPTPSTGGQTVASSIGGSRRQSHIPRLSVSGASASNTPLHSPSGRESAVFIPEPMIRSRAARASAIHGGRTSLGLPGTSSGFSPIGRQQRTSSNSDGLPASGRRSSMLATAPVRSPYLEEEGEAGPYVPNMLDPLDVEVSQIVNSQPFFVHCRALDPPLTKAAAAAQTAGDRMARYHFGLGGDKPISCKLVERGAGKGRKVLCRVGGVWQDLAVHLLNQQALY